VPVGALYIRRRKNKVTLYTLGKRGLSVLNMSMEVHLVSLSSECTHHVRSSEGQFLLESNFKFSVPPALAKEKLSQGLNGNYKHCEATTFRPFENGGTSLNPHRHLYSASYPPS